MGAQEKRDYYRLLDWFSDKSRALIAYSGGVDSTVVASVAKQKLGDGALAVTAYSKTFSKSELENAEKTALQIGFKHMVISYDDMANERMVENTPSRCYFCREELVSKLVSLGERQGIQLIVDGTNLDDLNGHRPGVLAMRKAGVRSPLAEEGISKERVRALAKWMGLPNADRPSNSCLASRIPYGERITEERMSRVAVGEELVRMILDVRMVRVRDHSGLARIEVPPSERHKFFSIELLDRLHKELKAIGFRYVAMDLAGYRSGSLDEVLPAHVVPLKLPGQSFK